jgi:hypothetical protein
VPSGELGEKELFAIGTAERIGASAS